MRAAPELATRRAYLGNHTAKVVLDRGGVCVVDDLEPSSAHGLDETSLANGSRSLEQHWEAAFYTR